MMITHWVLVLERHRCVWQDWRTVPSARSIWSIPYIYICLYQLDLGLVVLFNFYLFDPCSIREMIIILSAQIWSDQNGHSVHYPIADATLQTLIRWSCILDLKLSPFFPMEYCYHDRSSVRTCIYWFFWGPWILSCCFRSSTTKRKRIVRRVVAWIVLCFVSRWN